MLRPLNTMPKFQDRPIEYLTTILKTWSHIDGSVKSVQLCITCLMLMESLCNLIYLFLLAGVPTSLPSSQTTKLFMGTISRMFEATLSAFSQLLSSTFNKWYPTIHLLAINSVNTLKKSKFTKPLPRKSTHSTSEFVSILYTDTTMLVNN